MANLVYINAETAIVWTVGGTPDLDLGAPVAADGVRVGQQHDFGDVSRSEWFAWHFHCDGFDTAPVVGETVDVYLAFSDGTNVDGEVGTADAAGATTDLPNLLYLGSATVQTTTAGNNLNVSGIVRIPHRFVSVVIHNNTVDTLLSTADAHSFSLIAIPPEIQ